MHSWWFASARCEIGNPKLAKLTLPLAVIHAARDWLPNDPNAGVLK